MPTSLEVNLEVIQMCVPYSPHIVVDVELPLWSVNNLRIPIMDRTMQTLDSFGRSISSGLVFWGRKSSRVEHQYMLMALCLSKGVMSLHINYIRAPIDFEFTVSTTYTITTQSQSWKNFLPL
jgi:hypothetical protein